jgi:hypothetical protein
MSRTARLTDALSGRGKTLAFVGAAAALASAGTASAVAFAPAAQHAAAHTTAAEHRTAAAHNAASARHGGVQHPAVAHDAPGHRAAEHQAAAHHIAVRHAVRHAAAARRAPAQARPYEIYDSVTPSALPSHHEIATYANGGYAVSPSQVAGKRVLWIDTNGSDPRASALDVEPGDATPSMAAAWASNHLTAQPHSKAIIYTMRSEWPAAQASVSSLPRWMQHHIRWWIADPTGVPHIVPGANATQWYWGHNYDITTAAPSF